MKRFAFIVFVTAFFSCQLADGADNARRLELFGMALKDADRAQMRQGLAHTQVHAKREDDQYWVDQYDASAALEGASDLDIGYVAADGKFAFARYTFPSFMDSGLVTKVINLVSTKYGPPSTRSGNPGLGNVEALWNLAQGMQIRVTRGWPDTTTYLGYYDTRQNARMNVEIEQAKSQQEKRKALSQSGAF